LRPLVKKDSSAGLFDLSATSALVIDSNPISRGILVSQMRDFGVQTVNQCTRVVDARRQLEFKSYDFVLCEQHFDKDAETGQSLVDDLRRNQMLPFATVFIMVTGEATYSKVAEAAESALDGYLLKPHNGAALRERLFQARQRKTAMQAIFTAIDSEDFETAAQLCLERFEKKEPYWLYAARIGAELLLRTQRYAEAQVLYEAVVAARALPWAKLGVARAQLDGGDTQKAIGALETLIGEDGNYADAYDVLGRAQFELGRFDRALDTYKMAAQLTPHSISRMQNLGMLTYYCGDRHEAEKILGRAVRLGITSKMFDSQTLVLLALARLDRGDRKGLDHCQTDLARLLEQRDAGLRLQRQHTLMLAMVAIHDQQFARSVELIRQLSKEIRQPDFDFEAASNLLALLSRLSQRSIQLDECESVVQAIGLRYGNSRAMTDLLAAAAESFPSYAEMVRQCHGTILKHAENAIALSVKGQPGQAVSELLARGEETQSGKLIETAFLVLQRHAAKIPEAQALGEQVDRLRATYRTATSRPGSIHQQRQAGGLSLRVQQRPANEKV